MKVGFIVFLIAQLNCSEFLEQCPVCFKSFTEGEKIQTFTCSHKLHSNCLIKWICTSQKNSNCPKCGSEFSKIRIAALHGDNSKIKRLIAEGADVNETDEFLYGWTALYFAIVGYRVSTVKFLLENGTNVDVADSEGNTPVHVAALEGHESIVKILLAKKPETANVQNKYGQTPDMLAANNGHASVVNFLLKNGANVNAADHKFGFTLLHVTALKGDESLMRILMERNPENVNAQTTEGVTALMIVAWKGHARILKILLEKGANVDTVDRKYGVNALHYAAAGTQEQHESIVKMLLANNAKINVRDKSDQTPLIFAVAKGNGSLVQILLEKGANANAGDHRHGIVALHYAANIGHESIVRILLAHSPETVNIQTYQSKLSPLMLAASKGHVNVVKTLLEKGASTTQRNFDGKIALDLATDTQCVLLLELIRSNSEHEFGIRILKK